MDDLKSDLMKWRKENKKRKKFEYSVSFKIRLDNDEDAIEFAKNLGYTDIKLTRINDFGEVLKQRTARFVNIKMEK